MPCSTYARQIGAVPSGRSVSERSERSEKVYISFCTTSEPAPDVRANSAVSSNTGVTIRRYPYKPAEPLDLPCDALPGGHLGRDDVMGPAWPLDLRAPAHPAAFRSASRSSARNGLCASSDRERRRGPVARMDGRPRREALGERADRRQQRRPVAAREIGATDGARKQHVAREEHAVDRVRQVTRRVARDRDDVDVQPGQLERLAPLEEDVRSPRPDVDAGRRERVRGLEERALAGRAVDRCTGAFGELGQAQDVVEVAMCDQDCGAARAVGCEREPNVRRGAARVDDESFGSAPFGPNEVAVRLEWTERQLVDHGWHDASLRTLRRFRCAAWRDTVARWSRGTSRRSTRRAAWSIRRC